MHLQGRNKPIINIYIYIYFHLLPGIIIHFRNQRLILAQPGLHLLLRTSDPNCPLLRLVCSYIFLITSHIPHMTHINPEAGGTVFLKYVVTWCHNSKANNVKIKYIKKVKFHLVEVTKAYGEVDISLHSFLTLELDRNECLASQSGRLTTREEARPPLNRRRFGHNSRGEHGK